MKLIILVLLATVVCMTRAKSPTDIAKCLVNKVISPGSNSAAKKCIILKWQKLESLYAISLLRRG